MAILSRNTCGIAMSALESYLTRTSIEKLLYEQEVPNELLAGSSKRELLLNVFRTLEGRNNYPLLLRIVRGAHERLPSDKRGELAAALRRDGFVAVGDDVVSEETRPAEHKTALQHLVSSLAAHLSAPTLLHHLREAEDLFRLGKWDASVGQARNFVEQLLTDIANRIAGKHSESPDLSRPVKIRDYLEKRGFFDAAERKKLVDGVYGYFSEEGSHPGISKQSTARVCLSILWTVGFYLLEKFEEHERST